MLLTNPGLRRLTPAYSGLPWDNESRPFRAETAEVLLNVQDQPPETARRQMSISVQKLTGRFPVGCIRSLGTGTVPGTFAAPRLSCRGRLQGR